VESLPERARESLRHFLAEDLGRGDVTSEALVPAGARAAGHFLAKRETVVCGLEVARETFRLLDPELGWVARCAEGEIVSAGRRLAEASGNARALLSGERVALNLLQRMSGIASATRRYVQAVAGTACVILDTRKTAPGLRAFDKWAVVTGGGRNHRFGLDDGVLIKDNHIRLAGGVAAAVERARGQASGPSKIEVEVESEAQLREALAAGADQILFDNQRSDDLARLVRIARDTRPGVALEASGGITLENVRAYAETGVDFVSIGALTHSVEAADISFEIGIS
jgi:nicotinate-nucleotide pyrophosphorylase (carboxylating)